MPKIKAVNHFNQNFPILRCPKTNSAGFSIDHFLSPTPWMKLHKIFCQSKKYLTAETAKYAEIILNFLSQRSPTGA
jgi:hypothetical protein